MSEIGSEKIKLVFTGHVDHGKSTVIGRLLYDTHSLTQGAIDKVKRIAAETGQPFEYANLLDAFEEEQRQGITIDTTQLSFRTQKRSYVIIDAPGHVEFLKNMVSGASDAEAAFLVIDALRGVEEQSRRHAHMLSLLGIRQIALIVNKMDLVGFDPSVFERINAEMTGFMKTLGLAPSFCLPVSAKEGLNITEPSSELSWYSGPTVLGALDGLTKLSDDQIAFRLPIQDVYKFDDRRILAGRIESGRVSIGDEILISPGLKTTHVTSLAAWLDRDLKGSAQQGESVGLIVSDEFFNRRGEIISLASQQAPIVADKFRASIFWLGKRPLTVNERYKLKLAASETQAQVSEIFHIIDSSSLAPLPAENQVRQNSVAEVEITLQTPLALDLFSHHKATGRFVIVDHYDVAGGGIITNAQGMEKTKHGFVMGQIQARCEVFEEYYYNLSRMAVSKVETTDLYTVGDDVPVEGRSYRYPNSFDIIVFRDDVAVRIRNCKVDDLVPLPDFSYQHYPMVNGRGFALMVNSSRDWAEAKADYENLTSEKEALWAQKWLNFNVYRFIAFGDNV
ncbi:MAG: 50S ribosome-binding GTPase [Deltaproteobacteria bacterium]|nr:50S ribosome-binding GTPase [Deltaproteobacteria bacterium]